MDGTPPTASLSSVTSPRNTAAGTVTITFSEPVTGVDKADLSLTLDSAAVDLAPATLAAVSASQYSLDLSGVSGADGAYELTLNQSTITDSVGNALASAVKTSWVMDTTPPTAVLAEISSPQSEVVSAVSILLSEEVLGLDETGFGLTVDGEAVDISAATVSVISQTEASLDLSGVPLADGQVELTLDSADITDLAGNGLLPVASSSWVMDATAPEVIATERIDDGSDATMAGFAFSMSEEVSGVDVTDFVLTQDGVVVEEAEIGVVAAEGAVYEVTVQNLPLTSGVWALTLVADGAGVEDLAGNALATDATVEWETTYLPDPDAPSVVSIRRLDKERVYFHSARYEVTFNEDVTGVDLSDFSLEVKGNVKAKIADVRQVTGSCYEVLVSPICGMGKLKLILEDDDSIEDLAGNPLGGEGSANGEYRDGEEYKIKSKWLGKWWKRRNSWWLILMKDFIDELKVVRDSCKEKVKKSKSHAKKAPSAKAEAGRKQKAKNR